MILCPFSETDRTGAYAKGCVLGDVEALPELRALCKRKAHSYLLGRILFVGLPKVSVTADCDAGSGIFKWVVQSVSWLFLVRAWDAKEVLCQPS